MQQVADHHRVVHIGRCSDHRMHQPALAVDADMGRHPELPLIAFPRLMHLRVALFLLVRGGTGALII